MGVIAASRTVAATKRAGGFSPEKKVLDTYPGLMEFMLVETYGDGKPRQLPTLMLFAEDGYVKACLNDRDLGRVAFVSAASVGGLFLSLEEGLQGSTLDWRPSKAQGKGR